MIPPIIIDEHGDLEFFRSAADAERYLEPIDVENEEYAAYDSVGRRLTLTVERKQYNFLGGLWRGTRKAVVVLDEGEVDATEELSQILADYLRKASGNTRSLKGAPLGTLVEQALQHAGFCT